MNAGEIRESRADFDDREIADALGFCKDKALEAVRQLLARVMDSAEQLFNERARNPREGDPALWRSSAQQVVSQRQAVQQLFADYFHQCFDSTNPRDCFRHGEDNGRELKLELIDTQVFEQELLIERMAVRAGIDTQLHYNHLNRRFCFLQNRRIKPIDNPLGPHVLARIMLKSLGSIGLQPMALQAVMGVMENHFTNGLGQLYSDLNADLVRRGVLPSMKHHIWRTADALHGGRGKSRAAMTESQRQAMQSKHEALSDHDLGSLLAEFAAGQADSQQAPRLGREFKQAGGRLLSVMDHLESEMDESGSLLATLDQLEQDQQLEPMDDTTRQVMTRADSLAAAFQKPFRRNPASLQASLANRMSLHIGRMALVDPAFLINKDHPARKTLAALRQFADYLEIVDPAYSQLMVGRFEELLGQFEAACADQESMEELQVQLDGELEQWKQAARSNLKLLDGWYSRFARLCEAREGLDSELAAADGESLFNLYARLQLPHSLRTDTTAAPDLQTMRAAFDQAEGAARARTQVASAGLLGTLLEIDRYGEKAFALQGSTGLESYRLPSSDDFARVVKALKPGTWVQDMEHQDEMQLPELKRFFRAFGKGRWCVFVDGMGEFAGALNASILCEKLDLGLLKPLNAEPGS